MIPVDADFSQYKMVVAPVLYMVKEGMKEALESFVKNGGILITTYMSGIVDQSDNVHLGGDRKSTRLNSSHTDSSRMPSSA